MRKALDAGYFKISNFRSEKCICHRIQRLVEFIGFRKVRLARIYRWRGFVANNTPCIAHLEHSRCYGQSSSLLNRTFEKLSDLNGMNRPIIR